MILSNQVECLKCGDKPFSAHRHDFKYCKCEKVAVDGGMDYLKRMGNLMVLGKCQYTWTMTWLSSCVNV